MKRAIAIVGALAVGSHAVLVVAADTSEVLSLTLNGRSTGLVGEFQRCHGQPCATVADLIALGFVVPPDLANSTKPIPLSALPDVHVRIDETEQVIYVEAIDAALQTFKIGDQTRALPIPLSPSGYGAVVNYDILGNFSRGGNTVAGLIDVRAFGPFGTFENAATVAPNGNSSAARRLNTTYNYSNEDRLFRVRVGDVVTGALAWNRAIRLGGIQISSDFNLRPDLITYPLPSIQSSTVVPATVSLIANGVQQLSSAVQPGPFAMHMLPVITGAGEVSLAVQDELGRQTIITRPFYASNDLLVPGLTSFSVDTGMIRENYGSVTDHYSSWAGSASVRHGLTDWFTLEIHSEITNGIGLVGIGATSRVGTLGVANFALSSSRRNYTSDPSGQWGALGSIGFQRVSHRINFSVNATYDTTGYRDIGAIRGFSLPKSNLNVNIGYQLEHRGLLGISYISQNSYGAERNIVNDGNFISYGDARFRIVDASYSVNVASAGSFRFTAFKDLFNSNTYGASCGFSFFFGGSHTIASLESSVDNGQFTQAVRLAKSAIEPNDLGYRVEEFQGNDARINAELEYYGRSGRISGEVEKISKDVFGRMGMRGSLALIDDTLFASDHIDDSFAIVRTGDIGNIPVQYENRPIGTTDSKGLLLVPSLLSYQNNRLSLDPSSLPPDIVVGQTFTNVRPRGGSGIIVDFPIKRVHAAVVRLHNKADQPIPVGSIVEMEGVPSQTVGYDGEAYMQEMKPNSTLKVTEPNGSICIAHVRYKPIVGDIPMIGPVSCQ